MEFDGQKIKYLLTRKRVRNVNLRINSSGEVSVSAPRSVSLEFIESFIRSKGSWILEKCQKSAGKLEKAKYIDGELFPYLGEMLTLSINKSPRGFVKAESGILSVTAKSDDPKRCEKLVRDWYRAQALEVFSIELARLLPLVTPYGVLPPRLKLIEMKTRWGTCYPTKGLVVLNTSLVKAPVSCIDYVILHELTHFLHYRHDKNFYGFLAKLMPDYKERKKLLTSYSQSCLRR